jgi:hypothetical protein
MVQGLSFNFDAMSKFLTERRSVFPRKGRVFEQTLGRRGGDSRALLHEDKIFIRCEIK